MELHNINELLDKYFDGNTTLAEEKELKAYFSSDNVAPEHAQFKPLFGYYTAEQTSETQKVFKLNKKPNRQWLWAAASVVVMIGIGLTVLQKNQDQPAQLGTFDDPEMAYQEAQKAFQLIAENLNKGKQNIQYLQEFENNKNRIFQP